MAMVIHGTVVRSKSAPTGTPGVLHLETGFSCDTLELPWHNNQRGVSCTKPGLDHGRVWWSSRLKLPVVRYEDRDGRQDVLVHNGNFAADARDLDGDGVSEITQVHGCTAVGRGYGNILRRDGRSQFGIKASLATLSALIAALRDPEVEQPEVGPTGFLTGYHEVAITYVWAPGCAPEEV